MKNLFRVAIAMVLFIICHFESSAQTKVNPLEQLSHYIGTWGPPKDHPMVLNNPKMKDYKFIAFEWGKDKKVIWSKTGPLADPTMGATAEGMITYNPTTEKLVWLEYQISNEILFEGEYRLLGDNKVQREYTVYYAEGYETIPYPEREGWTRKFRETFTPITKNSIQWLTEAFIDGEWKIHNPNRKDVRAIRDVKKP